MVKKHIMVSIDEEVHKEAQAKQLNISGIAEESVREQLNKGKLIAEDSDKCEFCGREEVKASKETRYIGLTWLCPDERWICSSCLKHEMAKVAIAK